MTRRVYTFLFLLSFVLIGSKEVTAQRFYAGFGYSFFTDIAVSEPIIKSGFEDNEREPRVGVNILSISYDMKFNIKEFNDNLALSLAAAPCFGAGSLVDQFTFGNIRIPIYAQLDFGNLSTPRTSNYYGGAVAIGYEYDMYNLAGDEENFSFNTIALKLEFRYKYKHAFAFKMGMPKNAKMPYKDSGYIDDEYVEVDAFSRITSFQLSYIRYTEF